MFAVLFSLLVVQAFALEPQLVVKGLARRGFVQAIGALTFAPELARAEEPDLKSRLGDVVRSEDAKSAARDEAARVEKELASMSAACSQYKRWRNSQPLRSTRLCVVLLVFLCDAKPLSEQEKLRREKRAQDLQKKQDRDPQRTKATGAQYIGELCRYVLNTPAQPDDAQKRAGHGGGEDQACV